MARINGNFGWLGSEDQWLVSEDQWLVNRIYWG